MWKDSNVDSLAKLNPNAIPSLFASAHTGVIATADMDSDTKFREIIRFILRLQFA